MPPFCEIPSVSHYWLHNGRVPLTLLADEALTLLQKSRSNSDLNSDRSDTVAVDIEVHQGKVITLRPASVGMTDDVSNEVPNEVPSEVPAVDLRSGLIWPCFVDMHTHLDKGHIWPRSPNPDGTFAGALETVHKDSAQRWTAADVYRRMGV
ncbi:MAG: hypothetical protein DCF15_00470, partial [Phormidesmis priestleyi]